MPRVKPIPDGYHSLPSVATLTVRTGTQTDLPRIAAIYNDAVLKTTATFDIAPRTDAEQIAWFREHGPKHPILVAEDPGCVVGWASLSAWSGRCAYADTAELSVYVAESARGSGVGRRLVESILEAGRRAGLHAVISRIAGESEASVRLHEKLGFKKIGVMREVGRKFGRLIDARLYQYLFESNQGGSAMKKISVEAPRRAPSAVGTVRHIAFTMYPVKDMARARRFYEDELGLKLTNNFRDRWVEYHLDNGCFAITTMAEDVAPSANSGGSIAFEVDDVDAMVSKLRGKQTIVKMEPFSTPVCRMAVVLDPEGNAISIHAKNPGR